VQAKFNGEVELQDLDPPRGYTISGKGSGGVAGNARGAAKVKLEPDGAATRLSYDVDAQVTGKLAQLGSRLIDSTAKMLAGQFFNKFEQLVSKPEPEPEPEPAPSVATTATAAQSASGPAAAAAASPGGATGQQAPRPEAQGKGGIPAWIWAIGIALCIVLFSYYFKK
jgi:hypothetical protein